MGRKPAKIRLPNKFKNRSFVSHLRQPDGQKLAVVHPPRDRGGMKFLCALVAAGIGVATAAPRKLVVLDPGHGGSNPGAQGAVPTLREKHLTLAIATAVAAHLRQQGIDVELTRTSDRTLTLRQRAEIANRLSADLFISIHANASLSRTQRGYETYVLTTKGLDIDARALRGSTATFRPGADPEIALILDDIERGAAHGEAVELADRIQRALRTQRGSEGDRGVRQDSEHVLLGATMPAVLVELGFIDHPIEGRELADPAVQAQLAGTLSRAIEASLTE